MLCDPRAGQREHEEVHFRQPVARVARNDAAVALEAG